jgi:hypothetical protein
LCSRDPSPPPFAYVKGGGGIFADMAVHDLDMTRFLAGADPIDILAIGSCHIDKSIATLPGSEAFDTASCLVRYPGGVQAMVDVCRQSSFGYDQRAEVLGTKGMIQTDNVYPNTAKIYKSGKTRMKRTDFFASFSNGGKLVHWQLNLLLLLFVLIPHPVNLLWSLSFSEILSFLKYKIRCRFHWKCRYALRFLPLPIQRGVRDGNHCLLRVIGQ